MEMGPSNEGSHYIIESLGTATIYSCRMTQRSMLFVLWIDRFN